MMMPNPSLQRDLWRARLDSSRQTTDARATAASTPHSAGRGRSLAHGLRVQVGHALIDAGSWLSREPVDAARRAHHHSA